MFTRITRTTAFAAIAAVFGAYALQSCDDDSQIGQSIAGDNVEVIIDSAFTVTGHSVENNAVRSRTITQLIGSIQAPGFGSLSSDVVTQFMPANQIDSNLKPEEIDSLRLHMLFEAGAFTGDSIVPMGVSVYRLTKDLPSPIYSNFDPSGYYNPNECIGHTAYSISSENITGEEQEAEARMITVKLPAELGQEFCRAYAADPSLFTAPEQFAKKVFKGLYIKSSFGSGRIVRVAKSIINMHFHRTSKVEGTDRDTTINYVGRYFAVTPEIITNNNIRLTLTPEMSAEVAAGKTIIAAPAGLEAEMKFPAREIIERYKSNITSLGVINTLTMQVFADSIKNPYSISAPPSLLLVLKKDKDKFFAENQITDNKTSFYANYSKTTGSYTFVGLKQYILDLMKKDEITDDDVTFVLTPVNIETESNTSYWGSTTSTVTAINPYVTLPAMCSIDFTKTKIKLTYSKQTLRH